MYSKRFNGSMEVSMASYWLEGLLVVSNGFQEVQWQHGSFNGFLDVPLVLQTDSVDKKKHRIKIQWIRKKLCILIQWIRKNSG